MLLPSLLTILPALMLDLPVGSAPPPLQFTHFPDRLHAFIWRNWQLVPASRIAETIGARREDVVRIGHSMGLQGPPRISADQWRRSHITIIRRNWHILPYDQLLKLLEWTEEQLAFTLREDDFLYVKLGSLKPRCEPLRYAKPDAAARLRAAQIAATIHQAFPDSIGITKQPLFRFVSELSSKPAGRSTQPPHPSPAVSPRFCYSYFGLYGDPLADTRLDPYPDGYLARLASAGVDGVWLQGVLSKLHTFPWDPSLSEGSEQRLANLRRLVARARRHGIRVFLYLNEPRAMPIRFFEPHPDLKGTTEGDHATLCTSVPAVRDYLTAAVEAICRAVPDLGGFFTITMSENLTNCWSHGRAGACPNCSTRAGAEGIAEVNLTLAEGIRRAGGRQTLIAWDWGWPDDWAEAAIAALAKPSETRPHLAFMSVSEWSLPITRGGVSSAVGEYSISSVGPGPRARRHWGLADRHGLRTVAKIQAAATWEMSAVPYVPAMRLVAEHARNLRSEGLDGVMLGWTLGGYPSPNLQVVLEVMQGQSPQDALTKVAEERFGGQLAPGAVRAWNTASDAFAEFPFHIGVAYTGPQQAGPSNLLWLKPTGYSATMVGFPYDDLDAWRAIYPPEVFIDQMQRVADGFEAAAAILRETLDGASEAGQSGSSSRSARRDALRAEEGILTACALHFGSVADQARFVALRRQLAEAGSEARPGIKRRMRAVIEREIARAVRLHAIQSRDPRIGFEASNQYYYVPVDLGEKVLNCRQLLQELDQG